MVGVDDLDTYRESNDLGPDEPAPREPRGEPAGQTDQFTYWLFDAEESERVPDTFVLTRDPSPLDFRMWVFAGKGPYARFVMRASHRYGEDVARSADGDDCCEVLLSGESLAATHCPRPVVELVESLTGAEVVLPDGPSDRGDSPVRY